MENLLRSKEYWGLVEQGYEEPEIKEPLTGAERRTLEEQKLKDLRGNARVQRAQLQRLCRDFKILEMQNGECVNDYISRVMLIANDMRGAGETMEDRHIVEKILRTLSNKYIYILCSIEESKDINEMTVDELHSSLLVHEHKIKRKEVTEQALKVTGDSSTLRADERFGDKGRGRGGYRGRGRAFNKSIVECYRYHKLGHFQYECPTYANYAEHTELDEGEEMLLMSFMEINQMSGDRKWFSEVDQSFRHNVKLGNDSKLVVMGKGNIQIKIDGRVVVITEVFYILDQTYLALVSFKNEIYLY
ncbi:uncharacterized protein LOC107261942 [Ricinus communis]|uniref:uncharacterized protein LOC107261942 n=1 Tax=Ricinus communis TaxID=3988 RepID=UPI0007721C7D|nr:uncharacterized protein LOC107261942 [Ricinus communis]|eukprot:XP_015579968.1 uncharacterized protein LOC107261942 [Ricinus communis]